MFIEQALAKVRRNIEYVSRRDSHLVVKSEPPHDIRRFGCPLLHIWRTFRDKSFWGGRSRCCHFVLSCCRRSSFICIEKLQNIFIELAEEFAQKFSNVQNLSNTFLLNIFICFSKRYICNCSSVPARRGCWVSKASSQRIRMLNEFNGIFRLLYSFQTYYNHFNKSY